MVVNELMKKQTKIYGQVAPAPKLTKAAALLLAFGLSIPVFLVLSAVEILLL